MYLDILNLFLFFFFFSSRRRHTRFDCDWSSDVCSSDLLAQPNRRASSLAVSSSPIPPPSWEGRPSISIGFESDGTWTEGLKLPRALQCNSQPVDGKKRKFRTTK